MNERPGGATQVRDRVFPSEPAASHVPLLRDSHRSRAGHPAATHSRISSIRQSVRLPSLMACGVRSQLCSRQNAEEEMPSKKATLSASISMGWSSASPGAMGAGPSVLMLRTSTCRAGSLPGRVALATLRLYPAPTRHGPDYPPRPNPVAHSVATARSCQV